jgi:hypothetical protein
MAPNRPFVSRIAALLTRREWAFVAVVVFSYVFFLQPATTNSVSRYDMVAALSQGTAIIDKNAANTIDVSFYHGHYYSPRSLGLSLLATPFLGLAQTLAQYLPPQRNGLTPVVAFLTLLTVVPVCLAGAVVFARLARRLRPALAATPYPVIVATAFGLGTLYFAFGVSFFGHAFAAALDLLAFYLLYRARSNSHPERLAVAAGLLVGFAVISEYPSAITALVLCAYVWAVFPARRPRTLLLFVAATIPSALLLGWYDWFAFGNPLHLSYDYVAGQQFAGQHSGLFGVGLPSLDGLRQLLLWPRGLLVNAPVLAFIPLGFVRWLRSAAKPPAEALACLAVSVLYPLAISGYFLPMAGENLPGPRLLVPMLPFACLALIWTVDDARRWVRAPFAAALAASALLTFLWVALGVREYHTFPTYPFGELFGPLLQTGLVPRGNHGDTPPNIAAAFFGVQQNVSIYLCLVPLLAWLAYLIFALLRAPSPEAQPTG